ncbi:MAG: type II toxin-antitoxin system VapC family toxin [Fibrella sp.]|nr:type II toxin-antitoxin system VapC family toxin [Armatimonadota bacterium]
MNALLDTHTFLWWLANDPQLSDLARDTIRNPTNYIFVSPASAWEIAIKCGTGKLTLPELPPTYVTSRILANGFEPLPITIEHVLQTYHLPFHHRDPFDRLLIAQSIVEDMPIISVDAVFASYPVRTIW